MQRIPNITSRLASVSASKLNKVANKKEVKKKTAITIPKNMGAEAEDFFQSLNNFFDKPSRSSYVKLSQQLPKLDKLHLDKTGESLKFAKKFVSRNKAQIESLKIPYTLKKCLGPLLNSISKRVELSAQKASTALNNSTLINDALDMLSSLPLQKNILDEPNQRIMDLFTNLKQCIDRPDNKKQIKTTAKQFSNLFQNVQGFSFHSSKDIQSFALLEIAIEVIEAASNISSDNSKLIAALNVVKSKASAKTLLKTASLKKIIVLTFERLIEELPTIASLDIGLGNFDGNPSINTGIKASMPDLETVIPDEEASYSEFSWEDPSEDVFETLTKWDKKQAKLTTRDLKETLFNSNTGCYEDPTKYAKTNSNLTDIRFFTRFARRSLLGLGHKDGSTGFMAVSLTKQVTQLKHIQMDDDPVVSTSLTSRYRGAASIDTVTVWETGTNKPILFIESEFDQISDIEIFKDFVFIAIDKSIQVWNIKEKKFLFSLNGHKAPITALTCLDSYLVSASKDTTIRIWNYRKGNCRKILRGHAAPISSLIVNDNMVLTSGDESGTIKTWNGAFKSTIDAHKGRVQDLTMRGHIIASCATDDGIRIWDYRNKKPLYYLKDNVDAIHLFKDPKNKLWLLTANLDGYLKLWQLKKTKPKLTRAYQLNIGTIAKC
jgi:WD40 repeat protein